MKKPLLILDFEFNGHHPMHLRHLVRYGLTKTDAPMRFLILRKLVDRTLPTLTELEKQALLRCTELLDDDPLWQSLNRRFRKHIACSLYFEALSWKRRGKERILLLYMETIFYGLVFSPLPRRDFSCLMFRPTFYYSKRNMMLPGWKALAVFLLKWVGAYMARLRPGIRKVFTLDPLAEEYGRAEWGTEKFQCVPDPLGPEPGMTRPIGVQEARPKSTIRLLMAGALAPRKGLKETVDAIEVSSEDVRRRIILQVIGEPDKDFGDYVRTSLDRCRTLGVQVIENLQFVSDRELDDAMEAADLVLVAYRGFKGSSGTVIRAAHFGKPVLSTDDGLMAYFVRTHKLGAALDVGNPVVFAAALKNYLETGMIPGFDPLSARRYADASEPQLFVNQLLEI